MTQKAMREISLESLQGQVKVQNDDWSFSHLTYGNTQYLTHFFHHWTAKFIPQIPQNIIRQYGHPGDIVVDPFMGCGTTLVEAKLLGCPSYGLDINPLVVKVARAKVSKVDQEKVVKLFGWLNNQKYNQSTSHPSLFNISDDTPAAFPKELPYRIIKLFSYKGELVLDPFLGSATTTKVCMQLDRNSIGYEIDPNLEPLIRQKLELDQHEFAFEDDTKVEFILR